jgi:ribonucleoside-diphosphate reductase alpha chain
MTNEWPWLNDVTKQFLARDYLRPNQSFEHRVDEIVSTFARLIKDDYIAEKFRDNLSKGWYSLATPIWTNYGTTRGLPISCYNTHVSDHMESILYGLSEVGMMSKMGGGTSGYFGDLRGRGVPITNNGESAGPYGFMRMFDLMATIVSQGKTRRGSFAAYLPIDHPDVMEFLDIKSEGNFIQDMSFAVCVPDVWMEQMIAGDKAKREVWARVLEVRGEIGYPYILFSDTVNRNTADVYKDKKMQINGSNLCSEVLLPSNDDESFVCCLSSMNALHFDTWKNTDAIEVLTFFLDTVLTDFIEKASEIKFMDRAVRFAERHRAIGIGVLGWHSYLQSQMIPFESMEAKFANTLLFRTINDRSHIASMQLAGLFGEPQYLKGYGRRNTTTMAVAPTTSSAFILGQVSQSIEPHRANYYIKDLAKMKYTFRNPHLEKVLEAKNENTESVWQSISNSGGSVQHLSTLNDREKAVFKTFEEISPREVLIQACARQRFIDQSQSLNLMIAPSTPIKEVNALLIDAWKWGIKTLYYQHSVSAAQEFSRSILSCVSCES